MEHNCTEEIQKDDSDYIENNNKKSYQSNNIIVNTNNNNYTINNNNNSNILIQDEYNQFRSKGEGHSPKRNPVKSNLSNSTNMLNMNSKNNIEKIFAENF